MAKHLNFNNYNVNGISYTVMSVYTGNLKDNRYMYK